MLFKCKKIKRDKDQETNTNNKIDPNPPSKINTNKYQLKRDKDQIVNRRVNLTSQNNLKNLN